MTSEVEVLVDSKGWLGQVVRKHMGPLLVKLEEG